MFNILLLVCVVYQVHQVITAPLDDELRQKIATTIEKLVKVIDADTVKIAKFKEGLEYVVSTAEDSLDDSFGQLKQFIKESKMEANTADVDIDECLNQTISVDAINTDELDRCGKQAKMISLQEDLIEITKKILSLPEVLIACGTNAELNVGDCLDNEISTLEGGTYSFDERVDAVFSDAWNSCFQCVEATLSKLDIEIDSIAHDFMGCVDTYLD
ncbi:hypothetical protein JTB14_034528 [Gonioctena quinquepunctata]|nr:hypothetical protein JTB14_034528 [Gonioctena quinquepunctata]